MVDSHIGRRYLHGTGGKQSAVFPTMPIVKEFSDVESAAGRPGHGLVEADKQRSHQVMTFQIPKEFLTCLGVIMRHTQHMTYKRLRCKGKSVTFVVLQVLKRLFMNV